MIYTPLSEVMTQDVITLKTHDRFKRVEEVFKLYSFHHIPILDDEDKVVGMVSKSDYLMLCDSLTVFKQKHALDYNERLFNSLLVEEIMSKGVVSLHPSDTIKKAADYFRENLFHAIPITEENGQLVGLITSLDLINFVFQQPGQTALSD